MWIIITGPSAVTEKVTWTWVFGPSILFALQEPCMVLAAHVKLCLNELGFLGKILYGKNGQNGPEIENFCYYFLQKIFLNKQIVFDIFLCKPHILKNSSS